MLEEVDLASLSVAHNEPVSVGKLLGIFSISHIWVAKLWRLFAMRELLFVLVIEFSHKSTSEDLYPCGHGDEVHCAHIHEDHGKYYDQWIEELFWQLELGL